MKDKRTQLIEAAMRLFANKGFHSTSIQEIVTESGMSKGAFYLHFSSKDELILAIFRFYYGRLWEKVTAVSEEDLPTKQTFEKQLEVQFKEIISHREFIMMQFQEQGLASNREMATFMRDKKKEIFIWHQSILLAIYGDDLKPYDVDAVIMLEGLTQTYFQMILLNDVDVSEKKLAHYIIQRLDDLVSAMIHQQDTPLMTETMIQPLLKHSCLPPIIERLSALITVIQKKITKLPVSADAQQNLKDALHVIWTEYQKDEPKKVVFQGMLLTFAEVSELTTERIQLEELLNME